MYDTVRNEDKPKKKKKKYGCRKKLAPRTKSNFFTEKNVAGLSLVSSCRIITECSRCNNPADAPEIFLVCQGNYGRVVRIITARVSSNNSATTDQ